MRIAYRSRDVTGVGPGHYLADRHCIVAARPNTEPRHDVDIGVSRSALEGLCSSRGQAKPECGFLVDVALQRERPVPRATRGSDALDTNLQHPFCERLRNYHQEHIIAPVRKSLSRKLRVSVLVAS